MNAALPDGPPSARLLDLTRLVSRIGRGPWTGIDRVEAAWLDRLLEEPEPLYSLVRTKLGFILIDREGTRDIALRLHGKIPWGSVRGIARLSRKANLTHRRAISDLRRFAIGRSTRRGLPGMLRRHLPSGTTWINLGHTNLARPVFEAVKALPGGRAHVFLHDVIPLLFPKWQDPRVLATFTHSLRNIAAMADLVICNSETTRADAAELLGGYGRVPPMLVAPLGISPARPDFEALPSRFPPNRPYFTAIGTQQPHKNHALLLDIWEHFAKVLPDESTPVLCLIGARSPTTPELGARLDASPLKDKHVFELSGLTDGAVSAMVSEARALLMPSYYEGFGLPVGEALALGTPALVNDLAVYRETLGNNPIYAKVDDMYSWAERILDLARAEKNKSKAADGAAAALPTWQDHFNLVLKVT